MFLRGVSNGIIGYGCPEFVSNFPQSYNTFSYTAAAAAQWKHDANDSQPPT